MTLEEEKGVRVGKKQTSLPLPPSPLCLSLLLVTHTEGVTMATTTSLREELGKLSRALHDPAGFYQDIIDSSGKSPHLYLQA